MTWALHVPASPRNRLLRRGRGRRTRLCLLWELAPPSWPSRLGDRRMPIADIASALTDGGVAAEADIRVVREKLLWKPRGSQIIDECVHQIRVFNGVSGPHLRNGIRWAENLDFLYLPFGVVLSS